MTVAATGARWLPRYAWISAWAAVATIGLKATAWGPRLALMTLDIRYVSFRELLSCILAHGSFAVAASAQQRSGW